MLLLLLVAALPLLSCAAPHSVRSGDPPAAAPPGGSRDEGQPGPIKRRPDSISWPRDFELGLEAARSIVMDYGEVEEDSLVHRYNRIGYRVASQTGRPDNGGHHEIAIRPSNQLDQPFRPRQQLRLFRQQRSD